MKTNQQNKKERNSRFTRAVRQEMERQRLTRVTSAVVNKVMTSPVERGFFVSVDHVIDMERRRRNGTLPKMSDLNRRMWNEIFATMDSYFEYHPEATYVDAAVWVVSRGRASRFFFSQNVASSLASFVQPLA